MDQTPGEKGPRFAIFVIRQYRRWGYFVAEHDWKFILLCLIITLFGLIKVFLTPYVFGFIKFKRNHYRQKIRKSIL